MSVSPQPSVDFPSAEGTYDGQTAQVVDHDAAFASPSGSISLWFNPATLRGKQGIFSKDARGQDVDGHLTATLENGEVVVRLQSTEASHVIRGGAVAANEWHHLVVSWGDSGFGVSVDGKPVGHVPDATVSLEDNAQPIAFGASLWKSQSGTADNLQQFFCGEIADARFHPKALEGAEVAALATARPDGAADEADPAGDPAPVTDAAAEPAPEAPSEEAAAESGGDAPDASAEGPAPVDVAPEEAGSDSDSSGEADVPEVPRAPLETTGADTAPLAADIAFDEATRRYDGTTATVIEHDPALAAPSGTIALWFNADAVDGTQALFSKDGDGYLDGGHLTAMLVDGEVRVRLQSATSDYRIKGGTIAPDSWHHLAVSWGDDGFEVFVDGTSIAHHAWLHAGLSSNDQPITFGASMLDSSDGAADNLKDFFTGEIAGAGFHAETLDDAEVAALAAIAPVAAEDSEQPSPEPAPDLGAEPDPAPDPAPAPDPVDGPVATPEPEPFPDATPDPDPIPEVDSEPLPAPAPSPAPQPEPEPVTGDITVSNATELLAALAQARGGEVIVLENGNYGSVVLKQDFSDYVTFLSANPGGAVFNDLDIAGGSHIRLDGITVNSEVRADGGAQHLDYVNATFNAGLYFRDASDIRIADSEIVGGTHGVIFNDVARFELTDSVVRDARSDLVRVTGNSYDFKITDNALLDVAPLDGDHPDAVQIFSYGGYTPHAFEISGNFVYDDPNTGRAGLYMQGFFIGDPANDGAYRDVLIENNLLAVGSPNTIFVNGPGSNVVIRENTLLSWEEGGGGAKIRILDSRDVSSDGSVTIEHNVARGPVYGDGAETWGNWGDNYFYGDAEVPDLFADSSDRSTWEAFIPKDGSAIDFDSGYGALDRLTELTTGADEFHLL